MPTRASGRTGRGAALSRSRGWPGAVLPLSPRPLAAMPVNLRARTTPAVLCNASVTRAGGAGTGGQSRAGPSNPQLQRRHLGALRGPRRAAAKWLPASAAGEGPRARAGARWRRLPSHPRLGARLPPWPRRRSRNHSSAAGGRRRRWEKEGGWRGAGGGGRCGGLW